MSLGRIVAPHGVRGEVRLLLETDFPERLPGRTARLGESGRETRVRTARAHRGGLWLVALEGVDSREAAEALRGVELLVDATSLPPLPEGQWYRHELVGLQVRADDGRELGRLVDVLSTGANDVFVVRGPAGEILLPALRSVVRSVDLDSGRMTVTLPPGLLGEEGPVRC